MNGVKSDDYDSFRCIGGSCPESCCLMWEIVIDDESLEKYEKMKSPFGNRLQNAINWEEGVFKQHNNRCALLNDEGLCDLQLTEGEEALCYTCGMYPRHVEDFENVREYSLSVSCPEVARLLCKRKSLISFVSWEDDIIEEEEFEDFDFCMYSYLQDAREAIYELIRDRKCAVTDVMAYFLSVAKRMQERVNEGNICGIAGVLESLRDSKIEWDAAREKKHFSFLFELEHLRDGWTDILDDTYEYYFGKASSKDSVLELFENLSEEEDIAARNLLLLFTYIYFCGAVYDDMVFEIAALCVYLVRWTFMVYRAKGGRAQDLVEAVYRVAREIEHSDENLDAVELYFMNNG